MELGLAYVAMSHFRAPESALHELPDAEDEHLPAGGWGGEGDRFDHAFRALDRDDGEIVLAAGELPSTAAVLAEARLHCGHRERGDLAHGAQSEPFQPGDRFGFDG